MAPPISIEDAKKAATQSIFNVTFNRDEAESSNWELTYLKELADELKQENGGQDPTPHTEIADRILIARLSLDAEGDVMSDDSDQLAVLASLPKGQTSYDYLVGAWKRCRAQESKSRKELGSKEAGIVVSALEEVRSLIVSYVGLVVNTPDMFPNHSKPSTSYLRQRQVSPLCLVPSLLKQGSGSFASNSDPYSSSSTSNSAATFSLGDANRWAIFEPFELPLILADLAKRFDSEGLDEIIGPALTEITRQIRDGPDDGTGKGSTSSTQPATTNGSLGGSSSGANGTSNANEALNRAAAAGDVQAVLAHLLGQAGQAGMPGAPVRPQGNPTSAPVPSLGLTAQKEGMNIGGMDWNLYVMAVADCVDVKPIANAIASLPNFNPTTTNGPMLERDSLLGPVLRLSSFADTSPSLCSQFYGDGDRARAASAHSSLRTTLAVVHSAHFRIFNSLVRAGPSSREAVLGYWGRACDLNRKRGAMRVKAREVATDGFMVNLFEMLMRFSEPFMDYKYSKIDRIDPEYLRRQKRFDVSELTRLNATEPEAKEWADQAEAQSAPPNFITETFFIALRLANLGLGKAIRTLNDRVEEMQRLKKRTKEVEESRSTWASTPQAMQYDAFIKRAQAECKRMESEVFASECQLLDDDFISRTVVFISFVMTWLVRVADPHGQHPLTQVELPLPKEVPVHFKMLPEHIFEDVCDVLLFLGRYKPDALTEAAKTDLVTFCTTFLSSGWFIRNPFLKAKLAEILFYNVLPFGYNKTGVVGDTINFHPLALRHLVPALMSFWIEAESTGSHTQFYDKFNIRYHLSRIFETIWSNPQHKERLHAEASGNDSNFVIFVNRLLNDVTFLLDDALEKLLELHSKQVEMDSAEYQQKTAEERQEFEGHVRSTEGQIRSMLQFGHEFLGRLIDFTGEPGRTKDAFMQPEIVARLASMLNYNLDLLVGPRCQELKIKDPKRVRFNPRELLKQILSVYLNLAARHEFVQAIARDGRSYRKEIFEKACRIAQKHMLKGSPELDVLMGMVGQVEAFKTMEEEEEEDLGDVPDEFLDPLMATLMLDPVILPSSKAVLDLSTIKSHLLSDATDPFNRAPLKLEDVQEDKELKERILAFRKEKKRAKPA